LAIVYPFKKPNGFSKPYTDEGFTTQFCILGKLERN
jgi:hypothetical protein